MRWTPAMLDRLTDLFADLCLALLLLGTLAGLGAWELIRSADDAAAGGVHFVVDGGRE